MALYDGFAPPINSTGSGETSNPASTGVVVAAIDSTQLQIVTGSSVLGTRKGRDVLARLTATLGGNSSFVWRVEQSISSTITDAPKFSAKIHTPANQTGVYTFSVVLAPGDYVRARGSDTGTGIFNAFLQIDPLL
jgi:hypothetical protein